MFSVSLFFFFFFFNDTATTEIYTLSLHDALPISFPRPEGRTPSHPGRERNRVVVRSSAAARADGRSEEHTSELQSLAYLVCRLLLEKKKKHQKYSILRHIALQLFTLATTEPAHDY